MKDDFEKMYKNGKFSDVILRIGKKTFPAHKVVLTARSDYFSAMFDHDMKESKSNEIVITDIDDPSILPLMLQFMYTGKVEDLTFNKAVRLFSVADKYSLPELRQRCASVILSNMSVDNVCQIANLAYMHSDAQLKIAANYFFCNYKDTIFKKKEWKEIYQGKPSLASDIVKTVNTKFNTKC